MRNTSVAVIPPKVSTMLLLLASDKDGEVVAAARGIGRVLAKAGLDWHALVAALDRPAPRDRTVEVDFGDLHGLAVRCLQVGRGRLDPKSYRFLNSIVPRLAVGLPLSAKQQKWLRDIALRLGEDA